MTFSLRIKKLSLRLNVHVKLPDDKKSKYVLNNSREYLLGNECGKMSRGTSMQKRPRKQG